MQKLSVFELFNIYSKKIKQVLIVSLFFAALMAVYINLKPNTYVSQLKLIVSQNRTSEDDPISYNQFMLNEKLVSTYKEILESTYIYDKVMEESKIKYSRQEYLSRLKVDADATSSTIGLKFSTIYGYDGIEILSLISKNFKQRVKDVLKIDNINELDEITVSNKDGSKKMKLIKIFATFIVFMFISTLYYILKTIITDTIADKKYIEDLGVFVLGEINE